MAVNSKEYQILFALNGQLNHGFTQSFSKASDTVRAMQRDIASLNSMQSQISAYEKQQSAISRTQEKLQLLQKQYENIQKEIQETGNYSSSLENKLLSKQAQIEKTTKSLDEQTAELHKLGASMEEAGIDTSNLKQEQARLATETDKLKKAQEAAAEQAEKMGGSTIDAINGMSNALVSSGLIEGFKNLAGAYGETLQVSGSFQAEMSQVAATMGTTTGAVSDLSDYAKEMGATTSFTAQQSAEGLNILAMAGLNAQEQISGLPVVLDLAAAGGMGLAQSAGYVTTTVKAFGDSMDNANYYADLMAKGATMANTNVSQLGEALATAGATANGYSQSAESVTLSLLRLAEQGKTGAEAGTMLNRAMTDLYAPTAAAKAILDELGISAYDSTGNARDFNDVVAELSSTLDGYNDQQKNAYLNQIFTTNGMNAFNKMTASTTEKVNAFVDGLENASGSAAQQAKTQLDNMNGAYTIMQSAIEGVQISMGELYQDDMTNLYKHGSEILTQMNEFIKDNPTFVKAIIGGAGALAGLTTGVVAFNTVMSMSDKILKLCSASIGGLPLLGVAAGIAGVVAVGGALYDSLTANDRAAAELSAQALNLKDVMADAQTSFDDTIGSVEATSNAADRYIDKLAEMEKAGLNTDSAQKDYHNTLELLAQTMPDLADQIDLENDKIKGGVAALRERAKAWEEEAKAQAYQEKMKSVYSAQADIIIEAEKNSIKLTKAQQDLTDVQKRHDDLQKEYSDTMADYNERLNNCSKNGENYARVHEEMEQYQREFTESLFDAENEMASAQDAYDIAQKAVDNDREAVEAANEQIELSQQAYENLTGAVDANTSSTDANKNTVDDFNSIINDTAGSIEELSEKYQEAYDSAYESISGQWGLWDEAAKVSELSIGTINSNLEGQAKYWEDYNSNLELVQENVEKFDGLSDVLANFVDGSENSVNAVAGIADALKKGDDGSVQKLVDNYQALQKEQKNVSDSVADMQTEFTAQMKTLTDNAAQSVSELDMSSEARAAARSTINGYIREISDSTGKVSQAYKDLYNAAQGALGGGKVKGYASGTRNAEQGVKLVGEDGPELVAFQGGETVYNANETKAILAESPGINAEMPTSSSSTVNNSFTPSVNVNFNITGGANESVMAQLDRYGSQFAERVLEVLRDNSEDLARRAFA